MKEIRLCDSGDMDFVSNLCIKENLGIEFQTFHNPYLENKEEVISNHKEKLSQVTNGKSFHAPFWDLNLGTKIIGLQNSMLEIYNESYNIAKELNCTEMIIHSNYKPGTDWYSGWILRAKNLLNKFLEDKDDSVTICIENQFESDSELLKNLIDEVNDSRVKICLDIGHANANSNMSVKDWIETLQDRIVYYHLHNNHGKQTVLGYNKDDEHLGLRDGNIDIDTIFNIMEEITPNAIWALESKPKYLEDSIDCLKIKGYIK